MPRRSELIAALHDSLPAPSGKVLAQRMSERLGRTVTVHQVHVTNGRIRRHSSQLGWTVPHVGTGLRKRYVRIPVQHEDGYELTAQTRKNVESGIVANVAHMARRAGNAGVSLLGSAVQMAPSARRTKLEGLSDDWQYLQRRTLRIAEDIRSNGDEAEL